MHNTTITLTCRSASRSEAEADLAERAAEQYGDIEFKMTSLDGVQGDPKSDVLVWTARFETATNGFNGFASLMPSFLPQTSGTQVEPPGPSERIPESFKDSPQLARLYREHHDGVEPLVMEIPE